MSSQSETLNIDVAELKSSAGSWTREEHARMLDFMAENHDFLLDNLHRNISKLNRSNKAHFFVRMSLHIGTKSDKQCKSRYQKKECQLLKELNLPEDLVDKYIACKRDKSRRSSKHRQSPPSTDACNSMVKADEPPTNAINSFDELKAVIVAEFMPRVQCEIVMAHLKNFVHNFPSENAIVRQMPSLSISPLRFYQPSMEFYIDMLPDHGVVFMEDCD